MIGNRKGFTLLEVIVAVGIFAVIILASVRIFQAVVSNQRTALIDSDTQENIRYFTEVFTRETRLAQRNTSGVATCGVTTNHVFATSTAGAADILYFKNSDNQCVKYYTEFDNNIRRVRIDRASTSDFVTSKKINIEALRFFADDASTSTQPLVTMNLRVRSENNPTIPALNIQTSITPRLYE